MSTLQEMLKELPEERRHKIESRAQELIAEEIAMRTAHQEANAASDTDEKPSKPWADKEEVSLA